MVAPRRSRALIAGLGSALLCALMAPPASSTTTPARAFSAPIVVDKSAANSTGEPSIDVAPDGAIYIVAPDGPGVRTPSALGGDGVGGTLIWRSDDKGKAFRFLGSYDVPTSGGDADVVVAPNGTIYASSLSYAACSSVGTSTDRGETFLPVPVAGCGQIPISNDREWQAIDGNDTLYTVIGDTFGGAIELIRSTVNNPAVIPSVQIPVTGDTDYEWPGTVAVDQRTGTAYTVWQTPGLPDNCDDTKCAVPASAIRPDRIMMSALPRGATTAPAPIEVASREFDTFDSFVANAVDKAGRVYVVWSERHDPLQETWVMLSSSANGGQSWSAPVKVNAVPKTATFPWVSAGDDGRIAVSYYGSAGKGSSPQRVDADATWQVFSAFSSDAGRTFSEHRTTGDMNTGRICTSGTGCSAGGRNLLDFFETAVDADGCLLTTFTDNISKTPYVAFVRQTGGPGLLRDRACGPQPVAAPVAAPAAEPAARPAVSRLRERGTWRRRALRSWLRPARSPCWGPPCCSGTGCDPRPARPRAATAWRGGCRASDRGQPNSAR